MMIDSLEMTDEDRKLIIHQCNSADESKNCYHAWHHTMSDTAKVLAEKCKGQTIVNLPAP